MILNIVLDHVKEFRDNQYFISTNMLKFKSTHLFIASSKWESIYLEINDDIPEGYLKSLHLVCENIKIKLPETITDKTLRLLTELYPEKSGALRRLYLTGKSVKEALSECLV